jgi:hypothetical protein
MNGRTGDEKFISRFLLSRAKDSETRQINSQARQLIEAGEIYGNSLGQIEPIWRRLSRQAKS